MSHPPTRILIADDNADIREYLRMILAQEGYSVSAATDGAAALIEQRRSPADILITDLFMPERDGFETIRAFRDLSPGIRIVVISGDARLAKADYLKSAALMDVDATLRKPFESEALLQILRGLSPRR